MNNENKKTSRISKLVAGKGFYIVLFLCLTAIGISGYYLVDSFKGDEPVVAAEPASAPSEVMLSDESEGEVVAAMTDAQLDAAAAEEASAAAKAIRIWPLSGAISSGYSVEALAYSQTTDDWRIHDGVDMCGYLGEPVMAVTAGEVTAVYDDDLYGTTVEISHADSVSSRYSNLGSVPTVAVGDTVAAGDVIGAVGDTALVECAEEPHLHLQVFREGVSIDPADYIEN